jgi:hypothetical protein
MADVFDMIDLVWTRKDLRAYMYCGLMLAVSIGRILQGQVQPDLIKISIIILSVVRPTHVPQQQANTLLPQSVQRH